MPSDETIEATTQPAVTRYGWGSEDNEVQF
jgi:hypothetical protein